jgi:hypothetical protein
MGLLRRESLTVPAPETADWDPSDFPIYSSKEKLELFLHSLSQHSV